MSDVFADPYEEEGASWRRRFQPDAVELPIDNPPVDQTWPGPVRPVTQAEACAALGGYHDPFTGQCAFRGNVPPGSPRPPPKSYMEEENPPLPEDTGELSLSDAIVTSAQEYAVRRKIQQAIEFNRAAMRARAQPQSQPAPSSRAKARVNPLAPRK
jgi:hypothetical protein